MAKNKLTDLDINEVSLVDKAAIGEVFTLMKMADPDSQDDILKQFTSEEVVEKMKNMPDDQFISIMKELQTKYQEINKGGNKMGPDEIKEIVKSCVTEVMNESMETVNKNFSAINKSIDELQTKVTDVEKASKGGDQGKTCPNCGKPIDQCTCDKSKGKEEKMQKSLDDLNTSILKMAEGLGAIGELKTAVDNLTKSQEDVTKRLETIEKMENPSNHLDPDKVAKGAGGDPPKKENFWKSVLGPGIEPDQQ